MSHAPKNGRIPINRLDATVYPKKRKKGKASASMNKLAGLIESPAGKSRKPGVKRAKKTVY